MTRLLQDHAGRRIHLGKKLGAGGEAAVFEIESMPAHVAKLYHAPPSARHAVKLAHMVRAASPEVLKVAAWPQTTLHEPSGRVVGFAMARMTSFKALHLLYGPQSRRREFPNADWHFLAHVAMNCAAAFDAVHRAGAVIGDVNSNNVLASADDATIRLIDCDSFQLQAGGERFLCEVGVPEYTPPELQGQPYAAHVRTPNHDAFGLAVLVFHLLFMGRHPFFGTFLGAGDMPQERAIKELRFAFGRLAAAREMKAPPHSLAISVLPATIGELFERAFSDAGVRGGRPDAPSWLAALSGLTRQLVTCAVDPTHRYPAIAKGCPWCALTASGGPAFFMSPHLALEFRCAPADLDALLAELERALQSRPVLTAALAPATPAPAVASARAAPSLRWLLLFGSGLALCGVTGTAALVAPSSATIGTALATAALSGWGALHRWLTHERSAYGIERRGRLVSYANARHALDQARAGRQRGDLAYEQLVSDQAKQAREIAPRYARLAREYDHELAGMTRNLEAMQRTAHLQRHEIVDANIKGIGVTRKNNLLAYGIETAHDVLHRDISSVPGVGPKLQDALRVWASVVAASFRFDPAKSLPETERRALVARYRQRQLHLRGELEQRVAAIRIANGERARNQPGLRDHEVAAEAALRHAAATLAAAPRPTYREVWLPIGLVALWLLIVAARPTTPSPVPSPPPPVPAPVAAHVTPIDDFSPGTQLLQPGTGAPQRALLVPQVGKKQRLTLVTDAERSDERGQAALPEVTVRALVAIKQVTPALVVYQILIERAELTDPHARSVPGSLIKREVGRLAGTLVSIGVSPQGELRSRHVDRTPARSALLEQLTSQVVDALAYMFFELPSEPIAPGAQWRVRARGSPSRSDTTATVVELDAQGTVLERKTSYSPEPGGDRVEGELTTRFALKPGDIIPTVQASLRLTSGAPGPSERRQSQHVTIRPR